ncbi:hypothetical protein [Frankia sp. AgB1.9]|uniref:hypothetical protein n=1 Tax=Frankia sp. AgB1.9 TaxID=1836968 RepID=UPI001EE472E0|nr:hypothetical protein [Frankia sp. AgB1.9]
MALLHRLRRPDETFADDLAAGLAVTARDLAPAGLVSAGPAPAGRVPGGRLSGGPVPAGRVPARVTAARPVTAPAAGGPPAGDRGLAAARRDVPALPPSVARVAARTRLSAELLAAILEVDARQRATLDDIERADALARRLLARRADRQRAAASGRPGSQPRARRGAAARLAG